MSWGMRDRPPNTSSRALVITKLFKIGIVWELVVLFDRLFDVNLLQPIGTLTPEYNSVQRIVRESVIQELRNGSAKAAYFGDIVSGHPLRPAHTGKAEAFIQELRNAEGTPNESQLEVIRRGIEVEDALLVLGPPGTGKTTVILEWVKYFVKQEGKRVLISSQNNKAVDNVLERFAKEADIDTIRIGSEEKVQSNVKHLMFENRAIDLQHQIAKSMGKCSKQLDESEGHIQRYAAHAEAAAEVTRMLNGAAIELDKQFQQVREVRLPLLRSLYKDVLATRSRLEDIETGIHTIAIKLRTMERSAWAVKILQWPIRLLEKNKLKKKLEAHRMFVTREKELVLLYNEAYQSLCTAALAEIKVHTRQDYWDIRGQWNGAIEPLLHPPLSELRALNIHAPYFSHDSEQALQEVKELVWQSEAKTKSIHLIRSAMDRWSEYVDQKRNYALAQVLLESVDLVGATCIGINSQQRFKDLDFDVTIIDEAGQIQIHNAIVPMSRSSKVIMLGDHMQIPPIASGQVIERCEQAGMDESLLSKSFFEYLYERFPDNNKMLLDTQYRMPAQIADLLSEWFYEGKYMSDKVKRNMPSALPSLFLDPFAIVSTSAAPRRREIRVEGEGGGYYNEYEARIVAAIVRETLRTIKPGTSRYYHLSEIGVIAPYNAQVKHLRSTLSGFLSETSEDEIVQLVATLDSFQGQERPIIIYSCTRSNSKPPHLERLGFLKELRRLNVALSRSQMQLVFIGDIEFLRSCEYEQLDTFGLPMTDEWGKTMQGTSEKQFSMFINLLLDKAIKGNGQLLNAVDQFNEVQHV
jgi:GTPase SAR1 family protein